MQAMVKALMFLILLVMGSLGAYQSCLVNALIVAAVGVPVGYLVGRYG